MDYFKQGLTFKVRKAARYVAMYGPSRTLIKVRGQMHMRRRFEALPASEAPSAGQPVGILGCGNFAFSNIAYYLRRGFGNVIGACMDVDIHRAASMSRSHGIPFYTADAGAVIRHPLIRFIYIASNHASHAEYAIEALKLDKSVYIEKPHVVSEDQLRRLLAAMRASKGKVFLGFNRPGSPFGRLIHGHLDREAGEGMYNWFIAGHAIDPEHWYFKPEEGGRVLGNLCHWTDFILRLAPRDAYPIRITPTRARKSDCDIAVTYAFNDGTMAAITFSAKGHAFEGVKERFSAHKGNCLITMDDFSTMTIDVVEKKRRFRNIFRDHGHRTAIQSAYTNVRDGLPYDRETQSAYVWNTGWLFLKTREALERDAAVTIETFEPSGH